MGSRPALSRLVLTIQQTFRRTVTSGTTAPQCLVTKRFKVDLSKNANSCLIRSTFAATKDPPEASPAFRPQDVLLFDASRRADLQKQLKQPVMRSFHQQLQRAASTTSHRQLRCSRTAAGYRPSCSMLALALAGLTCHVLMPCRHHGLPVVGTLATSSTAHKQVLPGALQVQHGNACKASLEGLVHLWRPKASASGGVMLDTASYVISALPCNGDNRSVNNRQMLQSICSCNYASCRQRASYKQFLCLHLLHLCRTCVACRNRHATAPPAAPSTPNSSNSSTRKQ
jgi:hypothetical protein